MRDDRSESAGRETAGVERGQRPGGAAVAETDSTAGVTVTVRYWAAARAAAGQAEDLIERVSTVQAALDAAAELRPDNPRFAQVLSVSSFLLGDRPLRRDALDSIQLTRGDVVEVLPPFAGG